MRDGGRGVGICVVVDGRVLVFVAVPCSAMSGAGLCCRRANLRSGTGLPDAFGEVGGVWDHEKILSMLRWSTSTARLS